MNHTGRPPKGAAYTSESVGVRHEPQPTCSSYSWSGDHHDRRHRHLV